MSEKVTFSAFDPIRLDVPPLCDVCTSQPPMFHFEYDIHEAAPSATAERLLLQILCCKTS